MATAEALPRRARAFVAAHWLTIAALALSMWSCHRASIAEDRADEASDAAAEAESRADAANTAAEQAQSDADDAKEAAEAARSDVDALRSELRFR